ncbi:MAG: alpha-glucan family phosphorylase [Chthonomonas sp.]|nr:alpha-glucan family phosphorylase [Chthonomonas sp.]
MKLLKYAHSFEVSTELPEPLRALRKLAMNFRWTWHHETQALFEEVDPQVWAQVEHNPMELINRIDEERIDKLCADSVFLTKLNLCEKDLDAYLADDSWFDRTYPGKRDETRIAYFCAEFGIVESLPIYSGGLGILAGDHLKAASDLGLPLVGVGLLYSRGYFRQTLNADGWQVERYPNYDYYQFPLELLRGQDDQPIRVSVDFPDRVVTCQIWKARVGRIELLLLDSNVLENRAEDQGITDTLYGGDENMRIRQEMILGIGGMRALSALGIKPTVCHMNEGHAAFLAIERMKQLMKEHNCDVRTARQIVVAGNVFTTHTPVPAGFDVFRQEMIAQYMKKEIESLGIPYEDFLRYGRFAPDNANEDFNMAVLAMENANFVNGVSKLHAEVSRGMFNARWKEYPREEVPIEAVTNGIHTGTWIGRRMGDLLDKYVGPDWRNDSSSPETWAKAAEAIPDHDLWEMRENQRGDFIRYCRRRHVKSMLGRNASRPEISAGSSVLDPRVLTIGFARRFATYKRASLLFTDRERLHKILFHPDRPVQFVFAGKSHPRDDGGKKLIQEIANYINHEGGSARMLFLEDYDMEVARHLVQGVDVWLNNPRRPMEASGTSGMKVVPNGGLNCSVLDGWWAEGYEPGNGWAIGDESQAADYAQQDWLDSRALYHIIESEIAPMFYNRGEAGYPLAWVEMMKRSMRDLAPVYSTSRMVGEYAQRFYMPSSESFIGLSANGQARAKAALVWRDRVRKNWDSLKFVSAADTASRKNRVGDTFTVTIDLELGALEPSDIKVEVLVGKVLSGRELGTVTTYVAEHAGAGSRFIATIPCTENGHKGYVCRVVPSHPDVNVRSELSLVCWQDE